MSSTLTIGPADAAPGGCPTCTHAIACLTGAPGAVYFHCERCGTVVMETVSGHVDIWRPKLVDRCRDLLKQNHHASAFTSWLRRLGIIEAIWRPEERPT